MRILLVATRAEDADAVGSTLLAEGHTITSCGDTSTGSCVGVHRHDDCPLTSSVDVAIVARSPDVERGLAEVGAVCAARHRVGVVTIAPSDLGRVSVYDLADEAEQRLCTAYADAVTMRIDAAFGPDSPVSDVEVTRLDTDVRVVVHTRRPVDATTGSTIADRARAGVRDFDRHARVIDVNVTATTRH